MTSDANTLLFAVCGQPPSCATVVQACSGAVSTLSFPERSTADTL